jgi:hypothetical protein
MRSSFLSLMAMAIFVFSLSVTARAEIFTAYLTGAQEVPPAATSATGYARFFVNEGAGTCSFTVVFNGLSSAQTASHVHAPAPIGMTVGVAINLGSVGGTSGTVTGNCTITPTQLSQLRQHLGYVNVHSANFLDGEIRGQLGVARPVDYDGDGRTDLSVLRFPNVAPPGVSPITWYNLNSTTGAEIRSPWGNANTDFPTPGDFDGDGRGDIAIYRAGASAGLQSDFWILRSADNTFRHFAWGLFGDQAVARDYDGDGTTDVAVFRRGATATAQTTWYIRNSSDGTARVEAFGLTGNGTSTFDSAIPGDYDGDGKFDIAVYRFGLAPANNYIVKNSSDGTITYQAFGNFQSDYIVPGDFDGDGKYEIAAARTGAAPTSPLVWWIRQSSNGALRVQTFGISSDFPAQGDYDGDGRTDIAVFRRGATVGAPSFYWTFRSFDYTVQVVNWGLGSDFSVNTFDTR